MIVKIRKGKVTKKFVIKRIPKFNDYESCLLSQETILKSQQRFKSEGHNIRTEEISKTALSSNDDKRLHTFNKITSYLMVQMLEKYATQNC